MEAWGGEEETVGQLEDVVRGLVVALAARGARGGGGGGGGAVRLRMGVVGGDVSGAGRDTTLKVAGVRDGDVVVAEWADPSATTPAAATSAATPVPPMKSAPTTTARTTRTTATFPDEPTSGWLHFDPRRESVDSFLERHVPSTNTCNDWIAVAGPSAHEKFPVAATSQIEAFVDEWLAGPPTEIRVYDLAKKHGVRSGKWILYPTLEQVDAVWPLVARAVVRGDLGSSAKVSTRKSHATGAYRTCCLCVYVDNFADEADVARVAAALRALGPVVIGPTAAMYFKADAMTHLGPHVPEGVNLKLSLWASPSADDPVSLPKGLRQKWAAARVEFVPDGSSTSSASSSSSRTSPSPKRPRPDRAAEQRAHDDADAGGVVDLVDSD